MVQRNSSCGSTAQISLLFLQNNWTPKLVCSLANYLIVFGRAIY